jgi:hypothetical protein
LRSAIDRPNVSITSADNDLTGEQAEPFNASVLWRPERAWEMAYSSGMIIAKRYLDHWASPRTTDRPDQK